MGAGPIIFDFDRWQVQFPELVISKAALYSVDASGLPYGFWPTAEMLIRNDGCGPINDPVLLATLLYYTTAHVARLFSAQTQGISTTGGTEPAPPIVGRINTATEGSVSVGAEMPNQPQSAAWWNQTPYGAYVYKQLAPFRTMRYVVNPHRRVYNPPRRYLGGNFGYW